MAECGPTRRRVFGAKLKTGHPLVCALLASALMGACGEETPLEPLPPVAGCLVSPFAFSFSFEGTPHCYYADPNATGVPRNGKGYEMEWLEDFSEDTGESATLWVSNLDPGAKDPVLLVASIEGSIYVVTEGNPLSVVFEAREEGFLGSFEGVFTELGGGGDTEVSGTFTLPRTAGVAEE